MLIAGAHKWLGAYHPLGIALFGRRGTAELVSATCDAMVNSSELDDPLLRFIRQLEQGLLDSDGETLNLSPLFSCRGALPIETSGTWGQDSLRLQLENARQLTELAAKVGWAACTPVAAFRSGILLLQSRSQQVRAMPAGALRSAFHACGVALSAYGQGLVRVSMPRTPWRSKDLAIIGTAFRTIQS
jgi:hypothetical protein